LRDAVTKEGELASKYRTIHYKRAVLSDPTISLQSALSAALNGDAQHAATRSDPFTESDETFRLINRFESTMGMLFGQFIAYEPGEKPIITLEENSKFYPLNTADPGRNKAFTEEIFYFGVLENDLVCAQTRSLRSNELETHLAWLLTTCTNTIDDEVTIELVDQPSTEVYERVKNTSVKQIKIGTDLTADEGDDQPASTKKKFHFAGRAGEMIKDLIGISEYDKLKFEEDLDESNLHLTVEVKFLRKTDEEGQKAIDQLASTMRHIDEFDYEMKLTNGGTIKGDDLKVSGKVPVKYSDSGLIDETSLYKDMRDWLHKTLIDNTSYYDP